MHPADAHAVKDRGVEMIRKLLLPALAAALLGACATPYDYRGGHGDYYYGQPSVDYYDSYYGGYGCYGGMWGYGGYGYGYGYPYYGYGYPYYGYGYPYYPPVIIVRPDPPTPGTGGPHRPDPGHRPPGYPGPSDPTDLPGRGRTRLPSMADRDPGRVLRLDPAPYPRERTQREPSHPMLHDAREIPRLERDDGLKPHH